MSKNILHNKTRHYWRPRITNVAKLDTGNKNFNVRWQQNLQQTHSVDFSSVDYYSPRTEQYFSTPWRQTQVNIRIMESFRLERNFKIIRSNCLTLHVMLPSPPLNHVSEHHIYTSSKSLQGWWPNHFPGQPVPVLDKPFGEEVFPNTQPKPPVVQLQAISSCPIACDLGQETDTQLTPSSFQAAVEVDKFPPEPPLLQIKTPVPSAILHKTCAPGPCQLCCPFLDTQNIASVGGYITISSVFLYTSFWTPFHDLKTVSKGKNLKHFTGRKFVSFSIKYLCYTTT